MRYVPSIRTPLVIAKEGLRVQALDRIRAAKLVRERTLPPLLVHHPIQLEKTFVPGVSEDMRHAPQLHGERRIQCRRIEHRPILVELRSEIERRRHKQRAKDKTEHIDVEA